LSHLTQPAAVCKGFKGGVTIHRTGLLNWTTGLAQNGVKCLFQPFQCRREANHVYSAYLFAKFAPLACWANFTGVSRGHRSWAYL